VLQIAMRATKTKAHTNTKQTLYRFIKEVLLFRPLEPSQKRFRPPKTPRKNQPQKGFKPSNFNIKMQILLKYQLAEKLSASCFSARRNVLPGA
jgi:hypothetical protein